MPTINTTTLKVNTATLKVNTITRTVNRITSYNNKVKGLIVVVVVETITITYQWIKWSKKKFIIAVELSIGSIRQSQVVVSEGCWVV